MSHATFIYTLSNKPESRYPHVLWKRKLAQGDGLNLDTKSVSPRMVYWADVPYPKPDEDLAAYERRALKVFKMPKPRSTAVLSSLLFNLEFKPRPRKRGLAHDARQLRS